MEQHYSDKVPIVNEQPQFATSPPPGVVTAMPPGAMPQGGVTAMPPGPYYNQQVVVTQVAPTSVNTGGYIAYACFVFWCCNWPMGLIAFIFAMMASGEADSGNVGQAQSYGKVSVWISTAGIIMTVIAVIVVVAIFASGAATVNGYY